MNHRLVWALAALGVVGGAGVLMAAPPNSIWNSVGVCDYAAPQHCLKPAADGSLPVTSTPSGTGDVNIKQVGGNAVTTTVPVSGTVTLGAGSALAGKVGIDQTTPGTTNGVQVNAALPAGANAIGNVGGKTVTVCTTPTVTASNSYGTNYVVGGKLAFANLFTSTGSGILQSIVVTMPKTETSGFTFFPFSSDPSSTTWTDAAVAAINSADVTKMREPIALSANSQLSASAATVAYATGLGQAMVTGSTSMYGVLIANAALTNQFGSTSDIQVCAKVLQDL